MAIAYAIGRKVDDEIIRAALQPAMTGRDGTLEVAPDYNLHSLLREH
jgi:hypothetical protein